MLDDEINSSTQETIGKTYWHDACYFVAVIFPITQKNNFQPKESAMKKYVEENQNSMMSTEEMLRDFGGLMMQAAKDMGLDYDRCKDVKVKVLEAIYVHHKWNFDPKKGNLKSYLYAMAKNIACSYMRSLKEDFVEYPDDEKIDEYSAPKCYDVDMNSGHWASEDDHYITCEALKRMYEKGASKRQLKVLSWFIKLGVNDRAARQKVAQYTGETVNYVSVVKTRLLKEFRQHYKDIDYEDYKGIYNPSKTSIDFLDPILRARK